VFGSGAMPACTSINRRTPGFVVADLGDISYEAALLADRNDKEMVALPNFHEAIDYVVAGLQKKNRVTHGKGERNCRFP
jgi:ATP-dependent Zn protease